MLEKGSVFYKSLVSLCGIIRGAFPESTTNTEWLPGSITRLGWPPKL